MQIHQPGPIRADLAVRHRHPAPRPEAVPVGILSALWLAANVAYAARVVPDLAAVSVTVGCRVATTRSLPTTSPKANRKAVLDKAGETRNRLSRARRSKWFPPGSPRRGHVATPSSRPGDTAPVAEQPEGRHTRRADGQDSSSRQADVPVGLPRHRDVHGDRSREDPRPRQDVSPSLPRSRSRASPTSKRHAPSSTASTSWSLSGGSSPVSPLHYARCRRSDRHGRGRQRQPDRA